MQKNFVINKHRTYFVMHVITKKNLHKINIKLKKKKEPLLFHLLHPGLSTLLTLRSLVHFGLSESLQNFTTLLHPGLSSSLTLRSLFFFGLTNLDSDVTILLVFPVFSLAVTTPLLSIEIERLTSHRSAAVILFSGSLSIRFKIMFA